MANNSIKTVAAAIIAGSISAVATVTLMNNSASVENTAAKYARPYDLLHVMHQLQRFVDKIYFAGTAKNKRLTEWYLWKLEQAALHITNGETKPWHPTKYDEKELISGILFPAIQDLNTIVEGEDWGTFQESYETLLTACNACHGVTEHDYVRIIVPSEPIYKNQDYSQPAD